MGARRKPAGERPPWIRWPGRRQLKALLAHHRRCGADAFKRLLERPINGLLTIGVIAIALALPAGLYTGLKNLAAISPRWDALGDLSLYLAPGTPAESVSEMVSALAAREDIVAVESISPEQGLADMQAVAGFAEALSALPDNPLPWVVTVRPLDPSVEAARRLAGELAALDAVEEARLDLEWLQRLEALLDIGRAMVAVVAGLLGLAVVLVVGNTIRLDLESRRREVEVVRLLGATDGFIRRPFLYGGLWYGLLGGALAVAVIAAGIFILSGPVARLADAYNSTFRLAGPDLAEAFALAGAGAIIGWLGAWLAVSRQLARIQPD